MSRISYFIKQWTPLPLSKADLTDRVAIVTGSSSVLGEVADLVGANVGLGLEAARHLARFNPKKLILACRSQEKGDRGVRDINETTNVASGVVECWQLDLASLDSVKAFAKRVETLGRLDILIENAGLATPEFRTTKDGWEETFAPINKGTTAIISDLHPRITILSSGVHRWTDIPAYRAKPSIFTALNDKDQFVPRERYPASKLLDTLWVYELGQRLKASTRPEDRKISVSGVNPGLCQTQLSREIRSWTFWLSLKVLGRTAEMGSRTLVHAAVGADGEDWMGEYLSDCKVSEVSPFVASDEGKATAKRVWDETMEILSKFAPEVDTVF